MFRDKLTRLALRRAHSRISTPIIVRTQTDRLADVAESVRPFVEEVRAFFPRFTELGEIQVPFTPYPMKLIPRFNMLAVTLPREIIFRLAEDPLVETIFSDEPQYAFFNTVPEAGVFEAPHKVLDKITFTSTYWTKRLMGADIANDKGFFGRGTTVAVADTGASRLHEMIRRVRFETVTKQYRDENGHGTWCVSCVGGDIAIDEYLSQRSGRRVVCEGMAPRCDLLSVKCLGFYIGIGATSDIIDAIDVSISGGADVLSLSLGGPSETNVPHEDPYFLVMDEVVKYGVIPVVAAGNEGPIPKTIGTPGAMPQVLTVGAYDPISGKMADFSSRGPTAWGEVKPDVVAPGVMIDSAIVGTLDTAGDGVVSRFSPIDGTSMSTPHVAGTITLMVEAHERLVSKKLEVGEVKDMVEALGLEKSNLYGWGAITWNLYEKWLSSEHGVSL